MKHAKSLWTDFLLQLAAVGFLICNGNSFKISSSPSNTNQQSELCNFVNCDHLIEKNDEAIKVKHNPAHGINSAYRGLKRASYFDPIMYDKKYFDPIMYDKKYFDPIMYDKKYFDPIMYDKKYFDPIMYDKKNFDPIMYDKKYFDPIMYDKKYFDPIMYDKKYFDPIMYDKKYFDPIMYDKKYFDPIMYDKKKSRETSNLLSADFSSIVPKESKRRGYFDPIMYT